MENFISKIKKDEIEILKQFALARLPITVSGINPTGKPFEITGIIDVYDGKPTVNNRLIALDFGFLKIPYFFGYFTSELNILTIKDDLHRVLYENPDADKVKEHARQFKVYNDEKFAKPTLQPVTVPYPHEKENEQVLEHHVGKPVDIIDDSVVLHTVVYDYYNCPQLHCCIATIDVDGSQKIIGLAGSSVVQPASYESYTEQQTGGKRLC